MAEKIIIDMPVGSAEATENAVVTVTNAFTGLTETIENTSDVMRRSVSQFDDAYERMHKEIDTVFSDVIYVQLDIIDKVSPVLNKIKSFLASIGTEYLSFEMVKEYKIYEMHSVISENDLVGSTTVQQNNSPYPGSAFLTVSQIQSGSEEKNNTSVKTSAFMDISGAVISSVKAGKDLVKLGKYFTGTVSKVSGGSSATLVGSAGGIIPVAGAVVGGATMVSGVSDLYKGYDSEDEQEAYYYKTTGGLKVGGVAAGAAIGTAILPGAGTAIGAGIGGLAGLLGSKIVTADIEKTSSSMDGLAETIKKLREQELDKYYEDVSMSIEEVRDATTKLADENGMSLNNNFSNSYSETEQIRESMADKEYGINKINWKYNTGREVSDEEQTIYVSYVMSLMEDAYSLSGSEEYTAYLSLAGFFGEGSADEELIKDYYDHKKEGLGDLNAELYDVLEELENGADFADVKEQLDSIVESLLAVGKAAEGIDLEAERSVLDTEYDGNWSYDNIMQKQQEADLIAEAKRGEIKTEYKELEKLYREMRDDPTYEEFGDAKYDRKMKKVKESYEEQMRDVDVFQNTVTSGDYLELLQNDDATASYKDAMSEMIRSSTDSMMTVGMPGLSAGWEDNFLTNKLILPELDEETTKQYGEVYENALKEKAILEQVEAEYKERGKNVPQSLKDSLAEKEELITMADALSGDTDAAKEMIAKCVAEDEELQRQLLALSAMGEDIPDIYMDSISADAISDQLEEYMDGWADLSDNLFDNTIGKFMEELPEGFTDGLPEELKEAFSAEQFKNELGEYMNQWLETPDELFDALQDGSFKEDLKTYLKDQLSFSEEMEDILPEGILDNMDPGLFADEIENFIQSGMGNYPDIFDGIFTDMLEDFELPDMREYFDPAVEELGKVMEDSLAGGIINEDGIFASINETVTNIAEGLTGNNEVYEAAAGSAREEVSQALGAAFSQKFNQTANMELLLKYSLLNPGVAFSGTGTISSSGIDRFANGGLVSGTQFAMVGEEGPEAIIPLVPGRRKRGLELWEKAGEMLGVAKHADGGIIGTAVSFGTSIRESASAVLEKMSFFPGTIGDMSESLSENSWNYEDAGVTAGDTSEDNSSAKVEVNVSVNPKFEISGNESSDENIVEIIRSHMKEMADDLGGEIALNLEKVFSNMPVKSEI